jgi:hypothetical protein
LEDFVFGILCHPGGLRDCGDRKPFPWVVACEKRLARDRASLALVASPVRDLNIVFRVSMPRIVWVIQRDDVINAWREPRLPAFSIFDRPHAKLADPAIAFAY